MFLEYKNKIPSDLRLLFIDGCRVKDSTDIFSEFERSESGYFKACEQAFRKAISIEKLDINNLKSLHKIVTDNVRVVEILSNSGNIRDDYGHLPLKYDGNSTTEGIKELLNKFQANSSKNEKVLDLIYKENEDKEPRDANKNPDIIISLNYNKVMEQHGKNNLWMYYYHADIKSIENKISKILESYYNNINDSNNKLSIICDTIQNLEQLHPFNDANCRLFCMVLLNKFLLENGFYCAYQTDPNRFDGFSLEQLVNETELNCYKTELLCKIDGFSEEKQVFLELLADLDASSEPKSKDLIYKVFEQAMSFNDSSELFEIAGLELIDDSDELFKKAGLELHSSSKSEKNPSSLFFSEQNKNSLKNDELELPKPT
ncbi:Fic family protein [Thiotrichales bacterium 19S3-7]|nr:Fic family protein [Thiotrichales bacterium 19S3-7]MCF6801844.1 Fic family protein [Thiotrichales bacterium 19S3-11]